MKIKGKTSYEFGRVASVRAMHALSSFHRDALSLARVAAHAHTQKCSSLGVVRLAAENIMMASERSCERAFVRSFVRPGLALETGDKEGVSTAAIMIALSASPTPLPRSLLRRQCTPRVCTCTERGVLSLLHDNVRSCTHFTCRMSAVGSQFGEMSCSFGYSHVSRYYGCSTRETPRGRGRWFRVAECAGELIVLRRAEELKM